MLIYSGYPNVLPVSIDFKATYDTALELLPYDLKQICQAFKSHLGVDAVTDDLAPEWTANSMLMIELVGNAETRESPEQTITFNFHVLKARAPVSLGEDASHASYARYTIARLKRLLAANGNLNSHCGLLRIDSIQIVTGSDWSATIDPDLGNNVDGGTLTIQYTAATPEPFRLY